VGLPLQSTRCCRHFLIYSHRSDQLFGLLLVWKPQFQLLGLSQHFRRKDGRRQVFGCRLR